MRDSWKTTDVKYGAKASLATNPKPLKAETVEKLLGSALRVQNVRNPLTKGLRRHEYKAAHGLRKFFDNAADSAGMRYLHIEYLMGHDIGITGNYRRFQEQKLLEDYLKAVPFLTISSQKTTQLQQQVAQLTAINEAVVREAEEKAHELQRKQDDLKVMQEELVAIYRGMLEHFELNEPKTWKTVVKKTDPPKPSIESIDKIEQYCYNGNPNNNDDASYNNLQHLKEKLKPRSNYYSASFLEDLTQAAAATLAAKKEYEQEEKQWRTDRQQRQHITNPKTD